MHGCAEIVVYIEIPDFVKFDINRATLHTGVENKYGFQMSTREKASKELRINGLETFLDTSQCTELQNKKNNKKKTCGYYLKYTTCCKTYTKLVS